MFKSKTSGIITPNYLTSFCQDIVPQSNWTMIIQTVWRWWELHSHMSNGQYRLEESNILYVASIIDKRWANIYSEPIFTSFHFPSPKIILSLGNASSSLFWLFPPQFLLLSNKSKLLVLILTCSLPFVQYSIAVTLRGSAFIASVFNREMILHVCYGAF